MPEEVPTDEPPPEDKDKAERGGGDGKAKALGTPGLGEYGRPSRRNDAGEFLNEVSPQEG